MADQDAHETRARWEKMPHSKLSDDDVAAIKKSTETCTVLAARFGCSRALVSLIRNGKRRA